MQMLLDLAIINRLTPFISPKADGRAYLRLISVKRRGDSHEIEYAATNGRQLAMDIDILEPHDFDWSTFPPDHQVLFDPTAFPFRLPKADRLFVNTEKQTMAHITHRVSKFNDIDAADLAWDDILPEGHQFPIYQRILPTGAELERYQHVGTTASFSPEVCALIAKAVPCTKSGYEQMHCYRLPADADGHRQAFLITFDRGFSRGHEYSNFLVLVMPMRYEHATPLRKHRIFDK